MLYGLTENLRASVQLFQRHKLICPVRDAYVAWTVDDRLRTEFGHLRRFRPEGDCPGLAPARVHQKSNKRGISFSLHPAIKPDDFERAIEILIKRFFIINRRVDQIKYE